ncbi:xylose isomerase, partial [Muricauda sp. SYSU M86414]|nr:xylose isomerase [Muricauda sp. SYSU M86414]
MNRRNFVKDNVLLSGALGLGMTGVYSHNKKGDDNLTNVPPQFNLKYAPHLGMFKESAGDDPIDQLNFMA